MERAKFYSQILRMSPEKMIMLRRFICRAITGRFGYIRNAVSKGAFNVLSVKPIRTNSAMDLPASMKNGAIHIEMDVSIFNLHQKKNIHVTMNE